MDEVFNCYVTCKADEGDMNPSLKEFGEDTF
jgi:hypothetical protein